jgi:hypothetical protein
MNGVKEFADMLLDFYRHRNKEAERVRIISDDILYQAIGDRFISKGETDEKEQNIL